MKNLIKLFFDINRVSFLLIVLPFFAFNFFTLFNSKFFNIVNFSFLFFSLVLIDLLSKLILENLKDYKFFSILFSATIVVFFYGFYLTTFFQEFFFNYLKVLPRGRLLLPLIFLVLIGVHLIFRNFRYTKHVNIFLIIFGIINFSTSLKEFNNSKLDLSILDSNIHQIDLTNKSKKSVILIITDEYSSPDELFKLFSDSSIYDFSKYLQKNNWIVRNSSYSNEVSTIHSISSMFNFNLSYGTNYSNVGIYDVGSSKLLQSSFYDSLSSKEIKFVNFGIFKIGRSEPLYNLYKYPENFLQVFFINTVYNHVFYNTGGFELNGFAENYFPMEAHNKVILSTFPDSLNNISNNNFFSYVHLYMPHGPYLFKEEFDYPLSNDIYGYLEYWKFTNNKIEGLLSELSKSNKYRIILSGDHGFRADSRINSKKTFTAFYGFSEEDLISIKSVQDLGILINACY